MTLGTWYPPSFGTGSLLLTNPPFAMTTTFTQIPVPPPDQFRPRDRWFGPDGRSYRIKAAPVMVPVLIGT